MDSQHDRTASLHWVEVPTDRRRHAPGDALAASPEAVHAASHAA